MITIFEKVGKQKYLMFDWSSKRLILWDQKRQAITFVNKSETLYSTANSLKHPFRTGCESGKDYPFIVLRTQTTI